MTDDCWLISDEWWADEHMNISIWFNTDAGSDADAYADVSPDADADSDADT